MEVLSERERVLLNSFGYRASDMAGTCFFMGSIIGWQRYQLEEKPITFSEFVRTVFVHGSYHPSEAKEFLRLHDSEQEFKQPPPFVPMTSEEIWAEKNRFWEEVKQFNQAGMIFSVESYGETVYYLKTNKTGSEEFIQLFRPPKRQKLKKYHRASLEFLCDKDREPCKLICILDYENFEDEHFKKTVIKNWLKAESNKA